MTTPVNLTFPKEEFEGRLSALKDRMRARGLDVLLVFTPENIYYLTGYQTTGYYIYQCLIVPADQDPIMVLRESEISNIIYGSVVERYEGFTDVQHPADLTCETLRKHGLANKRIGVEEDSWFITIADHGRTTGALPEATWSDGSGLVEEGRVIKSPLEIETMREGARAVARGMQAGYDAAQVGRTEADVAGEVLKALVTNGSSYFASQPYICSGYRTGITHSSWTLRRLEKNEPIFFELSGNVKRYSTALMRTMWLGKPSDEARGMAEASIEALDRGLGKIRPGVSGGEVNKAIRDTVAKAGFGASISEKGHRRAHRTGYSIGLGFPPGWGEGHIMDLRPDDARPLKEGMTFHVIASMKKPGVFGVGVSETVLVTKTGHEPLTTEIGRDLFVK